MKLRMTTGLIGLALLSNSVFSAEAVAVSEQLDVQQAVTLTQPKMDELTLSASDLALIQESLVATGGDSVELKKVIDGPDSLLGLVLEVPGAGDESVKAFAWTTSPGGPLIFGSVLSGQVNYTQLIVDAYISPADDSVSASDLMESLSNTSYVMQLPGENNVSKEVFVVFDPLCKHCKNLYKNLNEHRQEIVDAGIQINWIPVAILSQKSSDYGAIILEGGIDALQLIEGSDKRLEIGTETPLVNATLVKEVSRNSMLFSKGIVTEGVPSIHWVEDGQVVNLKGEMRHGELDQMLGKKG